jgi:UDP-N-acetylmuramoyl-tripeptide--D-alanyl-D-alanine ligase
VDDPSLPNTRPDKADRLIVVDDALQTLQALAREHRRELGLPILAITGSNGKTTTKELVSRVLAEKYEVYATRGNLNNHIGVPLTLLAMTRDVEFGIVEMGASACGEIALLCSIAEPNYGIVTNIGRAHLEGFGGPEGVRRGKGELYDWLARTGGRVFVPANDPVLMSMAKRWLRSVTRPRWPTAWSTTSKGTTTASMSLRRSPSGVISAWTTNASAMP